MNMTLLWIFIAYFVVTVVINGIIGFISKKMIKAILTEHKGALEKIVTDDRQLSLVRKGYFIQVIDAQELAKHTDEKTVAQFKKIMPLTYVSYGLMAGLVVFLIIMVILMPSKSMI